MPKIFVSYRREDSAGHSGWLCDILSKQLKETEIFRDINSIGPGENFPEKIRRVIPQCAVMLVVIGKRWTVTLDRHKDEISDFVRMEVGLALKTRIRVIPILVGGATMPTRSELPDDLADLASLNAFELSDREFREEVNKLASVLKADLKDKRIRTKQVLRYDELPQEVREQLLRRDIRKEDDA